MCAVVYTVSPWPHFGPHPRYGLLSGWQPEEGTWAPPEEEQHRPLKELGTFWCPSQEYQLEADPPGSWGRCGAGLGPQPCSSEELMKGMGSGSGMVCKRKEELGLGRGLGSDCCLLCNLGLGWPRPVLPLCGRMWETTGMQATLVHHRRKLNSWALHHRGGSLRQRCSYGTRTHPVAGGVGGGLEEGSSLCLKDRQEELQRGAHIWLTLGGKKDGKKNNSTYWKLTVV